VRCSGARIAQSSQPHAAVSHAAVDLVGLTDYLVADPRLVRDLHSWGVAHLPVRVRDGTGLVGPLVIPGVTNCLD
jgi:2,4-dienoyl-CoA reductase-like NADH-dependent reductase (Old Yellow Enzyme family)